jgi:hypothetical protein
MCALVVGTRPSDSDRSFGPLCSGEIRHCEVVWVIKDDFIGNTFFDLSASAFLLPELGAGQARNSTFASNNTDRDTLPPPDPTAPPPPPAAAAAAAVAVPDVALPLSLPVELPLAGAGQGAARNLAIEFRSRVAAVFAAAEWAAFRQARLQPVACTADAHVYRLNGVCASDAADSSADDGMLAGLAVLAGTDITCARADDAAAWPLVVLLTTGRCVGCDFVVSATGVTPATWFLGQEVEPDCVCEVGSDGSVRSSSARRTVALWWTAACRPAWPTCLQPATRARSRGPTHLPGFRHRILCGEVEEHI